MTDDRTTPGTDDRTTPGTIRPVTLQTQEIRLASTLTGGVSLAVWMGGVAREIDLITQASNLRRLDDTQRLTLAESDPRRRYLDLINLLDVTVDVDVLSGTSAGGINAVLLAYGRAEQRDLGKVRDLWLQIGSLDTLLRDPTDPEVPSLLQGDAQMYASLCKALPELSRVANPFPDKRSTTLFVTTTLLTGETSRFTDSYGTLVQDVNHRGMFRFTERTLDQTTALALSARSSASFPGAFEPSFLPYRRPVPATEGVPARPAVGRLSNITCDHWVADGGLLDNQPIDALLEAIFERPARRRVRRVLLYIVPTSGPAPDPLDTAIPADEVSRPYTLLGALLKDLGAVWTQSISADLRAIREHNDEVKARSDMRHRLAQLAVQSRTAGHPVDDMMLLSDSLFADFRAREADQLARKLVPELLRLLSTWPAAGSPAAAALGNDGLPTVPAHWVAGVLPGSTAVQECRRTVHAVLEERWPAKPTDLASLARFGRSGYHGAKAIALSMLRDGFQLAESNGPTGQPRRADELAGLLAGVHGAYRPYEEVDVAEFVQTQAAQPEIQALSLPDAMAELTRRYLDAWDRPADASPATTTAQSTTEAPPTTEAQPTTVAPPAAVAQQAEGAPPAAAAGLATAWRDIASTIAELVKEPAAGQPPRLLAARRGSRTEQVATAAEHLRTYADYLAGAADERSCALRLFALYAAQRAMLPTDAQVDQAVELIQLSSDTRTLLDLNRSTAASKLTGVQMDHFGAFLKRSWRSNDWMWGRLDGAGWLIHLLLDPRRINTIATAQDGSRVTGFLGQLRDIGVPDPPTGVGIPVGPSVDGTQQLLCLDTVRAELAFLDDATLPVPVSLPLTALWVSSGRQQQIAAEELAVLAGTILDPTTQESTTVAARNWATSVQQTEPAAREARAAELLTACPVPDERAMDELNTPSMMRTAAKTAAVTAAAVNSMPQLPSPIRPVTSTVRTITLAGYRVINLVQAWPRRMILAGLVLLVVGCALATGQSAVFGLTGALIAAIGGYLLVFGAWQTSRAVLAAVLAATAVGGALSLTFPSVRRGLFGIPGRQVGWLNERVFWLGSQWWHPLLGLAVLLAVLAVLGMLFAWRDRSRPAVHRAPRWLAVGGAVLIALAVVALLAILLAVKGS